VEAVLQTSRDNDARAVVAGLLAFDFCFDDFGCKQLNIRMHHVCLFRRKRRWEYLALISNLLQSLRA
jgi:hypothetical protein